MPRNTRHVLDLEDSLGRDLLPEGNRGLSQPDPGCEPGDEAPLRAEKVDAVHGDLDISRGDIDPQQTNINPLYSDTSDDPHMELGQIIKQARMRRRLKQSDLAARINVKQSAISQWESGRATPELANRINLSATLGIPLNDLLPEASAVPERALDNPRIRRLIQNYLALSIEQRRVVDLVVEQFRESNEKLR